MSENSGAPADLIFINSFFKNLEEITPPICKKLTDLGNELLENSKKGKDSRIDTGISKQDEKELAWDLLNKAKVYAAENSITRRQKLFDKRMRGIYNVRFEILVRCDRREDRELVKRFCDLWEAEERRKSIGKTNGVNYQPLRDNHKILAIWKAMAKKNAYNPNEGYNKKTIEEWLGGPKAELEYSDGKKGKVGSATAALVQAGKASLIGFKEADRALHDEAKKVCLFKPEGKLYFESSPERIKKFSQDQEFNKHKPAFVVEEF